MNTKVIDLSYILKKEDLTRKELLSRVFAVLPCNGYHKNTANYSFTCPDKKTLCIFDPITCTVEIDDNIEATCRLTNFLELIAAGQHYIANALVWIYHNHKPTLKETPIVLQHRNYWSIDLFPKARADHEAIERLYIFTYAESDYGLFEALKGIYGTVSINSYETYNGLVMFDCLGDKYLVDLNAKALASTNTARFAKLEERLMEGNKVWNLQ